MGDLRAVDFILTILSLGVLVETAHYEYYRSELSSSPYFSSKPQLYKQQLSTSVTFNCKVENLGSSTLIWKKDGRMISAGNMIVRKDSRMRLQGQSLEISEISDEDSGQYICEVETFGAPLNQVHTLEVLVPPRVDPKPADGRFVVRKGSSITLECSGYGNPTPNITWTRKNNMLPTGEKSVLGVSLVISDVSRHHTGVYICTADNGVGKPSAAEIDLQVLYPPEIEIDQNWIKTKEGIESEVSCIVHGDPIPEVKWFKETMLLEPTTSRLMEVYGNRRVLLLRNFNMQDFGNYSCQAVNSLGKELKLVEVSGRPHVAKVISPPISFSKDEYNLTWTVDSFIHILEYRILYRVVLKKHDGLRHAEWTNIIPTQGPREYQTREKGFTYTGSFNFLGLDPDTEYEVIIQSRNKEGWSDPSQIFKFSTRSREYDPRGLELHKINQQGYFAAGAGILTTHLLLLTVICSLSSIL